MRIRFAQLTALAAILLVACGAASAREQGHFQKTLQVSGASYSIKVEDAAAEREG